MMTDPWYKAAFGDHYADLYSHRNAHDAQQAVDFVLRRFGASLDDARILDLCCGGGRHSLELLRRAHPKVVGLDLAANLLAMAKQAAMSKEEPLGLVRGDMRSLPFSDNTVDLVLNLFTSFGYFENSAENQQVLAEVGRVLKNTTGRMVLDHINPGHLIAHLVPETRRITPGGIEVLERRSINHGSRRVIKEISLKSQDRVEHLIESVRFYEQDEIEDMAGKAGLRVEEALGGFDDNVLQDGSPRAVYLLRKAT